MQLSYLMPLATVVTSSVTAFVAVWVAVHSSRSAWSREQIARQSEVLGDLLDIAEEVTDSQPRDLDTVSVARAVKGKWLRVRMAGVPKHILELARAVALEVVELCDRVPMGRDEADDPWWADQKLANLRAEADWEEYDEDNGQIYNHPEAIWAIGELDKLHAAQAKAAEEGGPEPDPTEARKAMQYAQEDQRTIDMLTGSKAVRDRLRDEHERTRAERLAARTKQEQEYEAHRQALIAATTKLVGATGKWIGSGRASDALGLRSLLPSPRRAAE
ncbi:hypothetical protein [Streptomyces chilikensis]|uniref:hypothetical protein n=1 Tax=Streptomyces chilikensis TaxID=1194079 RepID=UPI000A8822F4|nr:hypothetical protein [Streptomyces chilikensis]